MSSAEQLNEGLAQLQTALAEAAAIGPETARQEVRRSGRTYLRATVLIAVIVSLLMTIPILALVRQLAIHSAEDEVRASELRAATADVAQVARAAYALGSAANDELRDRGLAMVPIPVPGTVPDSAVFVAASTAQAAAGIARDGIAVPTPEQLRAEVAAQLAALPPPPVGPAPREVGEAVAAYVAANAEALRGLPGAPGAPGRTPPCLAEPAQCQGPQGVPGIQGEPPVGWTVREADGSSAVCERTADFDLGSPRYQCRVESAAPLPETTAPPVETTAPPETTTTQTPAEQAPAEQLPG